MPGIAAILTMPFIPPDGSLGDFPLAMRGQAVSCN